MNSKNNNDLLSNFQIIEVNCTQSKLIQITPTSNKTTTTQRDALWEPCDGSS